jgi:hypothetical protein
MNQRNFRSAFGAPDPAFVRAVRRTALELTKREEPVMRRKLRVSLLVAVLIVLLLAAVAFAAANHWGVLDFFKLYEQPIQPMESAKDMISTNLGCDENAKLRMTVREALYDGAVVRVVVEVAPKQCSNLLLVDPWSSLELDSGDGAGDSWREKAKASGKTLYTPDVLFLLDTRSLPGNGQNLQSLSYDDLKFFPSLAESLSAGYLCVSENDALVYSLTGVVKEKETGSLDLTVALPVYGDKTLAISFDLANAVGEKTWKLIPEKAELDDAGCILMLAELHSTPLSGYIDVTFKLKPRTPAAIDGQTTVYATKKGLYYHLFEHCSSMENANAMTVSEAEAKGKQECPVCLTGDRTYSSLDFELLDAQGNAIGLQEYWAKQPEDENPDPDEIFRIRGLFQPFEQAQAVYFLQPFDKETGERFQAVRCTSNLQPEEILVPEDGEW